MSTLVVVALALTMPAQFLREPLPVKDEPPSYEEAEVSQLARFEALFAARDPRLIEPTSPVLGRALVAHVRQDPRHPAEIVRTIDDEFPTWRRATLLSLMAYVRALSSRDASTDAHDVVGEEGALTIVEHAAIPLEVLTPRHARYVEALRVLRAQAAWSEASDQALEEAARQSAGALRAQRRAQASTGGLMAVAEAARAVCPSACGEFVDVNLRLASAEDSFPRVQYSVNGFTGFVLTELIARDDLSRLLHVVYDAERDWLDRAERGDRPARALVETVIDAASEHGFLPRDAILVLAFSTRNMPSIDLAYADDPLRALTLEVYFWKFRQMRDVVVSRHLDRLTEEHAFAVNPGVYHFATAGLHACELEQAGFPGALGVGAATGFKLAYKTHKLFYGFDVGALVREPISYVPSRMREQGYMTGVAAGFYGGRLGVARCDDATRAAAAD